MKKLILLILPILVLTFGSCTDFLNPDTDNVLDQKKYIDEESEMYAGYIGIITKVQQIGDKAILLTDTRGEMFAPTRNTPTALYSIYNYDADLKGNAYADPAGYYDVIIACNDYLYRLKKYKDANLSSVDIEHYNALVSCTLRIKSWIYLTLGKIYGKAVWLGDEPMLEKKDLAQFEEHDLDQIINDCKTILLVGFDGIQGNISMSWKEWLDPNTATGSSVYQWWDYMTPDYKVLTAELALWSNEYQQAATILLDMMNAKFNSTTSTSVDWLRNDMNTGGGKWAALWNQAGKNPYRPATVSCIVYDYSKNQTNTLLKHFDWEVPNQFLLAPSDSGMARFDAPLNNLGTQTSDTRKNATFKKNSAGDFYFCKFHPNASNRSAFMDDVPIFIYRDGDLYLMLAEALNNLGYYAEASALINVGVNTFLNSGNILSDIFAPGWTMKTPLGGRAYADKGIRGVFSLGNRTFQTGDITAEKTKANDLAILDESMLELTGEGKVYPMLIRIARRYGDYNIVADRVCPKYTNPDEIRAKIVNDGQYFVPWKLK